MLDLKNLAIFLLLVKDVAMVLRKLFILTALATCSLHNANAMEKENNLDLIENIRSIIITDRPDITYDGKMDHEAIYREQEVYKTLSGTSTLQRLEGQKVLSSPKSYSVCSDIDAKRNTYDETSHRLYDLCFTRWDRNEATNGFKKGFIVLWDLSPSFGTTTSKDPRQQDYVKMPQGPYVMSLENLVTQLQEDNVVYYHENFPFNLHDMLNEKKVKSISYSNGYLKL